MSQRVIWQIFHEHANFFKSQIFIARGNEIFCHIHGCKQQF